MIILTIIDGIPLFKDIERAILWGKQFGLTGYHAHTFDNQVGYMGGDNHNQAIKAVSKGVIEQALPSTINGVSHSAAVQAVQPTTTTTTTTTGGSGGY